METPTVTARETKIQVSVLCNAKVGEFNVQPHERVKALLDRALDYFGIVGDRQLMALFTESGDELPDDVSVGDAGVRNDEELVLRRSKVKGG